MLLWLGTLYILGSVGGRVEEKNPPTSPVSVVRIVAQTGEDVRISCPVEGKPNPYVEWSKEGTIIDYSWTRYKTHRKYLKIKQVTKEDAGVLMCKGINGFGSTMVRIELYISDSMDKEVGPLFSESTMNLNTLYKKLTGEQFSLVCEALGVPPPNITWFKESRSLSTTSKIHIHTLTLADSGVYSCLATNRVGQIKREFYLTVESPQVELPVIKHITNTTVYQGQTVELECEVDSGLKPDIQWLQESTGEEYSIHLGDMNLVHAGESQIRMNNIDNNNNNNNIINKVIKYHSLFTVTAAQSKVYVCLATNPAGGFSFKKSYLNVVPLFYLNLIPMVSGILVFILILILVIVVTWIMRSRQKLLLSQYQSSSYSTHIYDVPHYTPVSYTDTMSTPLSIRQSQTNSPRSLTYSNRSLRPETKEQWEYMKGYTGYTHTDTGYKNTTSGYNNIPAGYKKTVTGYNDSITGYNNSEYCDIKLI
ncbi:fibroblast growth factor receptor-like 1 [Eurytemora carolleeae]|uniref:fibroblast growth factor receptor-like 1 n=1 Tax=Eurytemora carolleeae TaxID=1294199 RepID=UPI000C77BBA3|nr:fibroblast growth factor receptor-like 1 [Eurytemora carolleeae]|eukprot:XP_023323964.1 fibroblast growth factor receptor-like 1 [Eurytemora affinis]